MRRKGTDRVGKNKNFIVYSSKCPTCTSFFELINAIWIPRKISQPPYFLKKKYVILCYVSLISLICYISLLSFHCLFHHFLLIRDLEKSHFWSLWSPPQILCFPKEKFCYLLLANDSWPTGECISEQPRLCPYGQADNFIRCWTILHPKCSVSVLQQAHAQSPQNTRKEKMQQ